MKASDIMTPSPCCCSPNDSLRDVAQAMRDNDCGAVPVVENGCIVGIVSQADLARAALDGQPVSEHEVAIVVERISAPRTVPFDRGAESSAEQAL